jgi:hypothetical protein
MLHACPDCGAERADADVTDRAGDPRIVCPACGRERSFVRPPLCIVTGAAGTGKTTIRRRLAETVPAVLLEDDAVADDALDFDSEAAFNEYVLQLCAEVAQSGVPPVLFTTGMGVPENVEGLTNRRYFGESHYLALVADEAVQTRRLRERPGWEGGDYWADVDRQIEFNEWFETHAEAAGIDRLDTADATVDGAAAAVADCLEARLPDPEAARGTASGTHSSRADSSVRRA